MIAKLIDKAKSSDLLFLSGIIINLLNNHNRMNKQPVLPELFSTLGLENTINLIKYFGGETLKIPSHEEMELSFLIILCYYKRKLENKDWDVIKKELNIDISPHTLGKIIQWIDTRISIDLLELRECGVEKAITKIQGKKNV